MDRRTIDVYERDAVAYAERRRAYAPDRAAGVRGRRPRRAACASTSGRALATTCRFLGSPGHRRRRRPRHARRGPAPARPGPGGRRRPRGPRRPARARWRACGPASACSTSRRRACRSPSPDCTGRSAVGGVLDLTVFGGDGEARTGRRRRLPRPALHRWPSDVARRPARRRRVHGRRGRRVAAARRVGRDLGPGHPGAHAARHRRARDAAARVRPEPQRVLGRRRRRLRPARATGTGRRRSRPGS